MQRKILFIKSASARIQQLIIDLIKICVLTILLGIKSGLQSRLNQQEQSIMQLQSDSLKRELAQQKHESDVAQLKWQLAERDKEVSALRNELVRREKTVDKQRMELEDAMRHIEELQYAQVWDNINPLIFKSNQCVTSPQCIHVTNC